MKKRIVSLLLCAAMLLTLLPLAAIADEYPSLTFKEEVTVVVEEGGIYWYQFIPTETKTYAIYSYEYDVVDPFATLYDAGKMEINRSDDYEGRNFCVVAELTAGETYYLEVCDWGRDDAGSFKLMVGEVVPNNFYISESAITRFVGAEHTLTATIYPEGATKTLTWTSSDESVATVDENGKITCVAGGEAVITAETVNGLTKTCEVSVIAFDGTIALGETTFAITEDEASKEKMLAFTPAETGFYRLYSQDIVSGSEGESIDPRVRVYDDEYNSLGYNDDIAGSVDFRLELPMEAGKTYYCYFTLYKPEATGSYKVTIEKMINATSVTIDGGDIVMKQGDQHEMEVTYAPEDCWIENYTVESSDESVVSASGHYIDAVGAGEATVTVTSDLGLTDSITVTVIGAMPLELDTVYTVNGVAEDVGATQRYSFTPTVSGRYTIASTEVVGEGATVYAVVGEFAYELRRNDTNTASFTLTYELEAGVEYFYDVAIVSNAEHSAVSFMVTKEADNDIPEAAIETDLPVSITNPGDGVYYAFKPTASGEYAIFSQFDEGASVDPKMYLYDDAWEQLGYDDDEDGDRNFRLEYEFTAGETYYIKAILYDDSATGEYTMRIELESVTVNGQILGVAEDTHVVLRFTEEGMPEPAYEVTVEGNGDYTVEDVVPATYIIEVTAEGYQTVTATVIVEADTTIDFEMAVEKPTYDVLFFFDESDEFAIFGVEIEEGGLVTRPFDPGVEGKVFVGWYLGDTLYDFSTPVTSDLKLVAKFVDEVPLGDLDGNGTPNTRDALALFQYASGKATLTEAQLAAADMDGNGSVNMRDALALFQKVSGR